MSKVNENIENRKNDLKLVYEDFNFDVKQTENLVKGT